MASEKPSTSPKIYFRGSCACSRLTYTCTTIPNMSQACHCISCRKLSGGPYQAYTDVPASSTTFYDNTEKLRYEGMPKDNIGGITFLRLSDVAERAYCVSCYTPLAFRYRHKPEYLGIAMGSVDEESLGGEEVREALRLKKHIFVSQKCFWDQSTNDDLPKVDRFSGTFEEDMEASKGKHG